MQETRVRPTSVEQLLEAMADAERAAFRRMVAESLRTEEGRRWAGRWLAAWEEAVRTWDEKAMLRLAVEARARFQTYLVQARDETAGVGASVSVVEAGGQSASAAVS